MKEIEIQGKAMESQQEELADLKQQLNQVMPLTRETQLFYIQYNKICVESCVIGRHTLHAHTTLTVFDIHNSVNISLQIQGVTVHHSI